MPPIRCNFGATVRLLDGTAMLLFITSVCAALHMTPCRGDAVSCARARPLMSADSAAKVYRRAQFWEPETATLEDIANVIGPCRNLGPPRFGHSGDTHGLSAPEMPGAVPRGLCWPAVQALLST